ncbi:hypothetical protein FI667_g12752, partial [Globisporangium splendens]
MCVSVCSGNEFFVRLVRIKTSEQQGFTLHSDADIRTCPILAVATALAMQTAPCVQLLEHVRPTATKLDVNAVESLPLVELLLQAEQSVPELIDTSKPSSSRADTAPGIHNQVNRLLNCIREPAGVHVPLSSHSFWRGGAQHANGDSQLSIQRIVDRGGWNLSATHKIFTYVFNTTQEDQRVSEVLSGWGSSANVPLDRLDMLDDRTAARVRAFQTILFNTCSGMQDTRLSMCPRALDACTSRLIRALPQLRELNGNAPIVRCVDACAEQVGRPQDAEEKPAAEAGATIQGALIRELLETNRLLVNRLEVLEAKINPAQAQASRTEVPTPVCAAATVLRRKAPPTHLSSIWFDWYAGEPQLWDSKDRKKRSEANHIVAFMKVFLHGDFALDPRMVDYRDHVMAIDNDAEREMLVFLASQGILAKGASSVLKHLRALHSDGKLDGYVRKYKARVAIGSVVDPAPRSAQDILPIRNGEYSSVSVCSGNEFFVRLVRIKTSEQQGFTLHSDADIRTCPILAVATALAMQTAPCVQLLEHVRPTATKLDVNAVESLPLVELLLQAEQSVPELIDTSKPSSSRADTAPGIHNQVNRLLNCIREPAGVHVPLSSHSFWRGGAQHANGDSQLSIQRIVDRGGWNLSATHKIFTYVFNTTQEDQRVSEVLSGWGSSANVPLDRLDMLDDRTAARVRAFQTILFNTCSGMQDTRLSMCPRALDACTSRLIRALPQLRELNGNAPIVRCVDACAEQVGRPQDAEEKPAAEAGATIQGALIRELLETNRLLVNRLEVLEAKINPAQAQASRTEVPTPVCAAATVLRRKAPPTHLSSIWFDWYAGEPQLWDSKDRKKRSEANHIVAFMKVFLHGDFALDPRMVDYRDHVMAIDNDAEREMLVFLASQGILAKGASSVLKHLRALHSDGKLDGYVRKYKARVAIGSVVDPAPRSAQDILPIRNASNTKFNLLAER